MRGIQSAPGSCDWRLQEGLCPFFEDAHPPQVAVGAHNPNFLAERSAFPLSPVLLVHAELPKMDHRLIRRQDLLQPLWE